MEVKTNRLARGLRYTRSACRHTSSGRRRTIIRPRNQKQNAATNFKSNVPKHYEDTFIPRSRAAALALACTACDKKNDAISEAAKADKAAGIEAPSIEEVKAIAEEGFIYGLPIVMNYAVMYEYAVDKNSSQFKAPFNHIKNEPRVYTYKDTAVITPNSDTPYSFTWLDLRAEPIVLTVPAVEKKRYYAVMMCDSNTYKYGYIGSRATGNEPGDYMVVGPDWKGEKPEGIKAVFTSPRPSPSSLTAPSSSTRKTCRT